MCLMQKKIRNFSAIFIREPEGGYTVRIPSLPGCVTYGKSLEEAQKMAIDAIEAYLASLKKHGEPIPSEEMMFVSTITIPVQSSGKKLYV